ncbi:MULTISPECIES: N-acetyltransferase [Lysinibacillus]|uniref:N-acetyltransferase n=1 Tax=Lysinibacillus sphaericus TaxID=1421 RepID=A0A544ULL1_LYSSH|nr:N-acetyltransferase [Lysinibacillus sp. SDF0037]TQR34371.1 N-acetyltransferase [Lysinibacillus sp. SDF0037]
MQFNPEPPRSNEELSEFLVIYNNKIEQCTGYCGDKSLEIYNTLKNDFSDLKIEDCFAVIYENETIIAALGFDVDSEKCTAEVWGPFIRDEFINKKEIMIDNLWDYLFGKTSSYIEEFEFFISSENTLAIYLIEKLQLNKHGTHLVLKAYKNNIILLEQSNDFVEYSSEFQDVFSMLHQQTFPKTYYNSNEMTQRLNEYNKLYILIEDNHLKGYVYFEANPEFGEGTIEYIAVTNDNRKRGIGTNLLRFAMSKLFAYKNIKELTLCVQENNLRAINLYLAAGFVVEKKLFHYKMK